MILRVLMSTLKRRDDLHKIADLHLNIEITQTPYSTLYRNNDNNSNTIYIYIYMYRERYTYV